MESKNAMAFPMYGEDFKICGIRLRDVDGKKWAVPSSREGIFRPYEEAALLEGPTVVCEGPTDTASLIQVGLHAIGAPSAGRGLNAVMAYCKARRAPVVIVGDADGEAGVDSVGVRGAKSLANGLTLARLDVRIVYPFKVKDAREWVKNGLTRREFFLTADAQNQWKVSA